MPEQELRGAEALAIMFRLSSASSISSASSSSPPGPHPPPPQHKRSNPGRTTRQDKRFFAGCSLGPVRTRAHKQPRAGYRENRESAKAH